MFNALKNAINVINVIHVSVVERIAISFDCVSKFVKQDSKLSSFQFSVQGRE